MRKIFETHCDSLTPEINQHMWRMLPDQMADDERNPVALPQSVGDIDQVTQLGSARSHLPNIVGSLDWLEKNAMCMDNLRPGQSTNAPPGRGFLRHTFPEKRRTYCPSAPSSWDVNSF